MSESPTRQAGHSRMARLFTAGSFLCFTVGLGILVAMVVTLDGPPSAFWMFTGGSLMVIGVVVFIGVLIWRATVITTFGAGMYENGKPPPRRQ